jgi:CP family cyanate transporter-like MFS transporter
VPPARRVRPPGGAAPVGRGDGRAVDRRAGGVERAPGRGPNGRGATALLLVAVVLTALNLRTAVTSVGPLLEEIRRGVGMSGPVAGLLTGVPVLCFAAVGAAAPATARRVGAHATLAVALSLMTAGVLLRAVADGAATFLACTVLALVGGAMGNVLLPMLVKQHFPDRIGLLTGIYTGALALGATTAAAATVPLADLAASTGRASDAASAWRFGLGVWAVPAAAAALAWLAVAATRRSRAPAPGTGMAVRTHPGRTRLGWALALFFGGQALQAYVAMGWFAQFFRDAGAPATQAGYLLAFLSGLTVPISLAVPAVAARMRSQRPLVVALVLCSLAGDAGMLAAPLAGAWVWALLVGVGSGAFPLALTLIGLRATTARETASLSAFTQSAGYVLAAAGPLLVGWLHDASGWTGPFVVLFAALALQLGAGLYAGRPQASPGPPGHRE